MSIPHAPVESSLETRMIRFALDFSLLDVGEAEVAAARSRLLDSIGVGMAAFLAPPARIARHMAQPTAGRLKARVWGSDTMTTPEAAAFANGVAVRYLDFNDAWRTRDAHHPSDYVPGLLALAEATGATGLQFLEAMIVAYEIMCRFTDAVPFNDAGWDQPVSGAMATTLACGRMLGLDAAGMRDALALSVIPNLCTYQTRAGELSMWKGCAGPNGARNAVFAALLASEGMTGPYEAFDGVFGLWNQTLKGARHEVSIPGPGHCGPWGIVQTNIKSWPVRDSCQLPIATALDLRAKLEGRRIESLSIETYRSAHAGAVKDPELWAPRTRETADHSMLFTTACALLDGEVTPDSFERGRFLDPDILVLIGQTNVEILPDFTEATPAIRNCRITARTAEGPVVVHRIVTLAEIEKGMPPEEIEAKFRTCTARLYTPARQQAILNAVAGFETSSELSAIPALLTL